MINLPVDVIHSVLAQFSDYNSLYSIISSSKVFKNVYDKAPASIMRSVAENMLKPDLIPPALRLARWNILTSELNYAPYLNHLPSSNDVPVEEHPSADYVLTWKEAKELQHLAKYANPFEDQFSRRYAIPHMYNEVLGTITPLHLYRLKDCTISTSELTPIESSRFGKALYRLWLFFSLPPVDESDYASAGFLTEDEDGEGDDGDGDDVGGPSQEETVGTLVNNQAAPLLASCSQAVDTLTREELLDIFLVHHFYETFLSDVRKKHERRGWHGLSSCATPDPLLKSRL